MITYPYLSMTLLSNVSRCWSMHINRCMAYSSLEDLGNPGAAVPLSLDPILLELGGGC